MVLIEKYSTVRIESSWPLILPPVTMMYSSLKVDIAKPYSLTVSGVAFTDSIFVPFSIFKLDKHVKEGVLLSST